MTLPLSYKIALVAAFFAVLFGIGWSIHHVIWTSGFKASKAQSDKERADDKARADAALLRANNWAQIKERKLAEQLAELSALREKEKSDAKITLDKLRADLRSAAVRLSIPVKPGSCNPTKDTVHSATAGGTGTEVRAELMPEAAIALVDIAADGDEAMRKHAKVVDAYESVRNTCNKEQE